MSKITSKLSLKKKCIRMTFLIFCSLFLSFPLFSIKHWNSENVSISRYRFDRSIVIKFDIIDYEFGPSGELGYMEYCDFLFSIDELDYKILMRCEVYEQVQNYRSLVYMKNKLVGADIQFMNSEFPAIGSRWTEDTNIKVAVNNISNKAYLTVRWFVPSDFNVKDILIMGKWHVNGLYCSDVIEGERYIVPDISSLNTNIVTDSITYKYVNEPCMDQPKNNAVKIYKEADALVIEGAGCGEIIKVNTTSGLFTKLLIANNDVAKIKLPVNQIYIVNIGQERFKVAL